MDLVLEDDKIKPFLEKLGNQQKEILQNPEKYTGIAEKKTLEVCNYWKAQFRI